VGRQKGPLLVAEMFGRVTHGLAIVETRSAGLKDVTKHLAGVAIGLASYQFPRGS
jgi:hypothetical protein